MGARPKAGVRLCSLTELPDPGARGFSFREGDELFAAFVVRRGGRVAGYVDSCPHAGWPLGSVGDRYLTRDEDLLLCSGHGALFRIEDGVCVAGPCVGRALSAWPVVVLDGEVTTA